MTGSDVASLLKKLIELGYPISDQEVEREFFGEQTRNAVKSFQSEYMFQSTGVVDASTAALLDKNIANKVKSSDHSNLKNEGSQKGNKVQNRPILKTEAGTKFSMFDDQDNPTVSGKIITNRGVAARGLKVIAVDKTLDKVIQLGEAITDGSGNYTISYEKEILKQLGKQHADIEIKIVNPQEDSRIYGISSTHFDADDDAKINLVLNKDSIKKTSEYNQIVADMLPYLGNKTFKDLIENEVQQDISYLANKTGWDARLVAMVSFADTYSSGSGIPPDFYYALFRARVSTNIDVLYRTNSETVKKIWEKSVEENIVDVSLRSAIEQNLAKFREIAGIQILETTKPVGVSSLKDLLNISLPEIGKQREFVDLYFNNTADIQSFWVGVDAKFGKQTSDKLRLDGKLAYLTNNNADLIGKLYSNNLVQKSPVDLIKNGLYKKEAWESIFKNGVTLPGDIPGNTNEEKKSNYIDHMIFQLKLSYPTSVVAEMVNNDELQVHDDSVKKEIYQFLQDMKDKFRIGTEPLRKVLQDNQIQLGENALIHLKKLERVYQISPSDDAMKVLWTNNLDSAHAVMQYDEKEFIGSFGNELGGEETAKMIYAKAHEIHSTVLNMALSYMTARNSPNVYAISGLETEKKVIPQ